MLVVQWPSLPHHIPFIVVAAGLSLSVLFSPKPSLNLKGRPVCACVIKPFYMSWKKTPPVLEVSGHTLNRRGDLLPKTDTFQRRRRWNHVDEEGESK